MATPSPDFLALLCCPQTRVPLRVVEGRARQVLESGAVCDAAGRSCAAWEGALALADGTACFPVRAGIPVLLLEERVSVPASLISALKSAL